MSNQYTFVEYILNQIKLLFLRIVIVSDLSFTILHCHTNLTDLFNINLWISFGEKNEGNKKKSIFQKIKCSCFKINFHNISYLAIFVIYVDFLKNWIVLDLKMNIIVKMKLDIETHPRRQTLVIINLIDDVCSVISWFHNSETPYCISSNIP